jgi:hypothetical protein
MMTYTTADGREGMVVFKEFQPLPVFSFPDKGHKTLRTHMGRTGGLARGCPPLGNGIGPRHGLGISLIDCLPGGEALIVRIRGLDGADLGAFAAASTLGHVDIARVLNDPGLEVPFLTLQFPEFCCCQEFDVQVPADLDQFGRDDSHGTVIGGKRLVQLGHEPADGRIPFHQIHIESRIRQIQG